MSKVKLAANSVYQVTAADFVGKDNVLTIDSAQNCQITVNGNMRFSGNTVGNDIQQPPDIPDCLLWDKVDALHDNICSLEQASVAYDEQRDDDWE